VGKLASSCIALQVIVMGTAGQSCEVDGHYVIENSRQRIECTIKGNRQVAKKESIGLKSNARHKNEVFTANIGCYFI